MIKGIEYAGKQTEYQYFPEDFFSGSDISLYFDDVYMDDVQAIEFGLTERVMPIYGYNSYTADSFARGQRIVQGSFQIAFKEAGYIYRVLEHIGQLKGKAKPALSYELGKGDAAKPSWAGNINETIEQLLNRVAGMGEDVIGVESAPKWNDMALQSRGEDVRELQEWLTDKVTASRYKGIFLIGASSLKGPYRIGVSHADMKQIKGRLNKYLFDHGQKYIPQALNVNSMLYDNKTKEAVRAFQKHFSKSLAVDGLLGPKTLAILNQGLSKNSEYDAPTKLAVMMFQKANGLVVDGILGANTRAKIRVTASVSTETIKKGPEANFAEYEASIWGEQSTYDNAFKNSPHFYGTKNQEWLLQDGFDIYVNYGQLPYDIKNGNTSDMVSYNNTVRAVRNVQITGVQQVLSPTGEPIAERYMFIAKDLD